MTWQRAGAFTAGLAALALAVAAVWVAADDPTTGPPTSAPTVTSGAPRAAAGGAEVAPRPYTADEFGSGWADTDRDGCDTRAEVLMRDMAREQVRDAYDGGCLVLSGRLVDPYTTGNGIVEARSVDVDHVVAKADAWYSGAWAWTHEQRADFANDAANLLATDASENRAKGARGPDEWLPPDERDRCAYAGRYEAVKDAYGLDVTAAQRAALDALACP